MPKYSFQFHYEKKTNEVIIWNDSDNISEPFNDFSKTIKENKDDLIFYFKGSSFRYKDCETNISFRDRILSQVKPFGIINILVFSLKKTKKLTSTNNSTVKHSSFNEKQELSSSEFVASHLNKEEKEDTYEKEETETSKLSSSNKENTKIEDNDNEKNKYYNDILCPNCLTSAIIENDGYGLKIINCENFHRISYMPYDRFETNDSFPSAKCGICSSLKSQFTPPYNKFYNCICGFYICPECHKMHSKDHYNIEIENKNYHCIMHRKDFNSYCFDCNMNICEICSSSHLDHTVILYDELKPKNEEFINDIIKEIEKQNDVLK